MEREARPARGSTPLLLITGFLGSGKTTLINRLLALPAQPRIGVVVNEFGQIGIDGSLLKTADPTGTGSGILELANGCVCCARGTEMWDAALELVDRAGAELLIVETSGLVEPRALLEQHRLLPPALASRIDLRGLLGVVDVLSARDSVGRRPEAVQQIELSDRLLLTKLDLATPAQLLDVHRLLDQLGASSERASLAMGAPDAEIAAVLRWALDGDGAKRRPASSKNEHAHEQHDHAHAHEHGGRQLMAVSLHEPEPLLAGPLAQLLRELRGEVLRAKGIVRVLGAPWDQQPTLPLLPDEPPAPSLAALHLAGQQVELQPLTETPAIAAMHGSTLVFIGEDLDENWLRLRLSACRSRASQPASAVHAALSMRQPTGELS